MAPSAELGPLDAQIAHPDREDITVSALDVSRALAFLGDFATGLIMRGGGAIYESTQLPRADVLQAVTKFAADFLQPMTAKLDPHLAHRASMQLDVAYQYATRMLRTRRLSSDDQASGPNGRDLAEHLVEHFPAHEFVISRDEARRLPLPIRDAEHYDRWDDVRCLHRFFLAGGFALPNSDSMVIVFDDDQLTECVTGVLGAESDDDDPEAATEMEPEGDDNEPTRGTPPGSDHIPAEPRPEDVD